MIFDTNKEKGNSALGIAIAYFSTNGYIVSIPLNDTQDYDSIVDKNNKSRKNSKLNQQVALQNMENIKLL